MDTIIIDGKLNKLKSQVSNIESGTGLTTSYNLFNPSTIINNCYIFDATTTTSDASMCHSDFIEIVPSTVYALTGIGLGVPSIVFYDSNKNYISRRFYNDLTVSNGGYLVTSPSNAKYAIVNLANGTGVLWSVYMLIKGSTYPTTYTQYGNNRIKSSTLDTIIGTKISDATNALIKSTSSAISIGIGAGNIQQENVAIGTNSMQTANIDCMENVAVGNQTMMYITHTTDDDGRYNVAVGSKAMRNNTTGNHNTAVGFQAMNACTTGTNNTALGEDALLGNAQGLRNTALGNRALQSAQSGSENVAVGQASCYWSDSQHPNGSNNTCVGCHSGQVDGTGSNNVAVGHYARAIDGANNTIAVGKDAYASKDNQAVLGNSNITETLVFGDFIVRGSDGVKRKIVFNTDGSCSWITVS